VEVPPPGEKLLSIVVPVRIRRHGEVGVGAVLENFDQLLLGAGRAVPGEIPHAETAAAADRHQAGDVGRPVHRVVEGLERSQFYLVTMAQRAGGSHGDLQAIEVVEFRWMP
jgi:hypothetical protein